MQVTLNIHKQPNFNGHGARNINQMMEKLYRSAYNTELFPHHPDVLQISAKMKDGTDVTGLACFHKGIFTGFSFPYEDAHYRKEFTNTILSKYNQAVTKGKYRK